MNNIVEIAKTFWQEEFGIFILEDSNPQHFPNPDILDPIWERYFPPLRILSTVIKDIFLSRQENPYQIQYPASYFLLNNSEENITDEEIYSKYVYSYFQRLQKLLKKLFDDEIQFPKSFDLFKDFMANLYCIVQNGQTSENKFRLTDNNFLITFLEMLPNSSNYNVLMWKFPSLLYNSNDYLTRYYSHRINPETFFNLLLDLSRQKHWIWSTFLNSNGSIDFFLNYTLPFFFSSINSNNHPKSHFFMLKSPDALFSLIEIIFSILICHYSEISRFNEIVEKLFYRINLFFAKSGTNHNPSLEVHIFRYYVQFLHFFKRKFPHPQFLSYFDSFVSYAIKSFYLKKLVLNLIVQYKQFGVTVMKHFRLLFEQHSDILFENNKFSIDDDDDQDQIEHNETEVINSNVPNKLIDHDSIDIMISFFNNNSLSRTENCFQFIQLCFDRAIHDSIHSRTICWLIPPLLSKIRNETQWLISFVKHITTFAFFSLTKNKYQKIVINIVDLLSAIYDKVTESVQIEISNGAALLHATKTIPFSYLYRMRPSSRYDKQVLHDLKVRCTRDKNFSKQFLDQKSMNSNFDERLLFSKLTPRQPQQPFAVMQNAPRRFESSRRYSYATPLTGIRNPNEKHIPTQKRQKVTGKIHQHKTLASLPNRPNDIICQPKITQQHSTIDSQTPRSLLIHQEYQQVVHAANQFCQHERPVTSSLKNGQRSIMPAKVEPIIPVLKTNQNAMPRTQQRVLYH